MSFFFVQRISQKLEGSEKKTLITYVKAEAARFLGMVQFVESKPARKPGDD
jgi:hypothetical protein